jgi:N6-adenosine-specific RNA methylase IME4
MANKKFQVIVSDPAWSFKDKLTMSDVKRGAGSQYRTLSVKDIKELKVKDIADPNGAILALWVPSSLLQEGLDTMKSWGFKHKQTYVWVKTKKIPLSGHIKKILNGIESNIKSRGFSKKLWKNYFYNTLNSIDDVLSFGMGRLFRQTHEICLIGINNSKIYKHLNNKSQRSVSFAPNLKHSAKPEDLQDSLDIMFPGAVKLEMFARRERPDWTCIGNEVCNGEDIRDSIAKLI